MKISRSGYSAVESLVRLAEQKADTPCTTQSLAQWINRSVSYTETLMARLRAAGLVRARRGPGGGYFLARASHRITVAEIFQGVDEPRGMLDRSLNAIPLEPEAIQKLHGTDLLLESFKSYILLYLNGVSLADIATEGGGELSSGKTDSTADIAPRIRSHRRSIGPKSPGQNRRTESVA